MQTFAAPIDPADQYGETPLHWAADRGQAAAVRQLLGLGARVEAAATRGPLADWTALHWAAARNHAATARVLLQNGARADAADRQRRTPRDVAAERGLSGMLQLLAQHAAPAGSGTAQHRPAAALESGSSMVDLGLPSRAAVRASGGTTCVARI